MSDEFVPVTGGCLCRAVRYEVDANLGEAFDLQRDVQAPVKKRGVGGFLFGPRVTDLPNLSPGQLPD